MTYDELKAEFKSRMKSLKLTDMTALNHKCAEILGKIVSENVFEIDDISGACKKILREYYEIMNETNARLQKEIDKKIGLQIAAQKADFPAERVAQIAKSLTDPTVPPETIQRRAGNAVENVANSFHDDYVKANAKFRSKAGIKCYIVRETDGNCCKWCSSLAGRYVYGDEPDDIFHRHDNCTCTATFENGRERQDVWSKKKWKVTPVLKIPYEPLVLDKNQAQNLQNIQLAKYKNSGNGLTFVSNSGKMSIESKIKWLKKGEDLTSEQKRGLIQYATDKNIILMGLNKTDVDIELMKEVLDDAERILKIYPELNRDNLPFTIKIVNGMNANDFAMTTARKDTNIIQLNANAFRNKQKLSEEYQKLVKEKWFAQNTTYRSIIIHEMGHMYAHQNKVDILSICKEILNFHDDVDVLEYVSENLSEYSSMNPNGAEIIAEVFSSFYSGQPKEFEKLFINKMR